MFGLISVIYIGTAPVAKPTPAKKNGKASAPAEESSEEVDSDSDEDEDEAPAPKGTIYFFKPQFAYKTNQAFDGSAATACTF